MARGQGLKPGRSQLTWGYERARNAAKVLRWWTCSHKTYTYPEWWIHPQSLLLHIPGVVNFMIVLAATKLATPGAVNLQPLCLHLSGVVNSQPGSLQNTERSLYTYKSLLMSLCNSLAKVYWCPCATPLQKLLMSLCNSFAKVTDVPVQLKSDSIWVLVQSLNSGIVESVLLCDLTLEVLNHCAHVACRSAVMLWVPDHCAHIACKSDARPLRPYSWEVCYHVGSVLKSWFRDCCCV